MMHLKLWSKSGLTWTQVTNETSILILNKFRDVLNPPSYQDVIWHIQMIQAAYVNWVRAQAACKSYLSSDKQQPEKNLYAEKSYMQKTYSLILLFFFPSLI